jgi:hypothetical protein
MECADVVAHEDERSRSDAWTIDGAHGYGPVGGRMPMTMTTPAGGSLHIPTVDDMANLRARLLEVKEWVDRVFILAVSSSKCNG